MKKAICSALILLMFLNAQASCLAVSLPSINKEKQTNLTLEEEKDDIVIPKKLKKEIKDEIIKIYGLDSADEIFNKVYEIAKKAKEERPKILLKEDLNRDSDWYKDEIIYTFYADQFGTKDTKEPNKFDDTAKMLDYLTVARSSAAWKKYSLLPIAKLVRFEIIVIATEKLFQLVVLFVVNVLVGGTEINARNKTHEITCGRHQHGNITFHVTVFQRVDIVDYKQLGFGFIHVVQHLIERNIRMQQIAHRPYLVDCVKSNGSRGRIGQTNCNHISRLDTHLHQVRCKYIHMM